MMLGAASLLAPRPEAFLAFIVPSGLAPAVRLVLQGDEAHLAMGLLASLFTAGHIGDHQANPSDDRLSPEPTV